MKYFFHPESSCYFVDDEHPGDGLTEEIDYAEYCKHVPLHIDYETFSEEDLKDAGVYRYAEHPSTEITACSYAFGEGQTTEWIPYDDVPADIVSAVQLKYPASRVITGATCPLEVAVHIRAGRECRAHNAQFERVITNGVAGQKLHIPSIAIEQTVCTAAKMAASGLPRGLDDAAKALGTPLKSDWGRIEMLQISKPRKPTKADPSTRWTMQNAPDKWIAMLCYNHDDTPAERGIDAVVPDLVPSEQEMYFIDQRINQRGIAIDIKAVKDILFVVEAYKATLAEECFEATLHFVEGRDWMDPGYWDGLRPTQRDKLADWVRANGYPNLTDMQAETVIRTCKRTDIPEKVKHVLRIYSTYNAKSVSKLQAMLDAVCSDGRLRGMFLFLGAATGRWSSLIVQLQNIMRPVIKDPEDAIEAFATRDLGWVQTLYPGVNLMKVAGSCVRSCLIAGPGKDLLFPDFSGIEDRVNLWFFNEEEMLEIYRAYDRDPDNNPHPYIVTVCASFGLDIRSKSLKEWADDPRRQWGKVQRLALGYEGGVAAFVTMVETYGIDLQAMTEAVLPLLPERARDHGEWMWANHRAEGVSHDQSVACDGLKFLYRQNHPKIRQGWKDLKQAAELAVENEGKAFSVNGKIHFKVLEFKGRKWLHMRLPSGRDIKYYAPEWIPPQLVKKPVKLDDGYGGFTWVTQEVTVPGEMRYWGVDTYTRQWMRLSTYGGKLDENADQGFSSDLLRNALRKLEAAGYQAVGTEHDKIIAEISEGWGSFDEAAALMCDQPAYCAGLPLTVDGKRQKRYGK